MHPLDFFNAFFTKCSVVITRELSNQKKWAAMDICATSGYVPFAVNKAKELAQAGRNVQVVQVGPEQYQCQYYDGTAVAAHVRRALNLATASCTCLEYQTYRFPCKDVFAALQATQGNAWMNACKQVNVYVDTCYHMQPDMAIIMNPVMVPDMEMLVMMRNSDYAMAMAMENEELGLTEVKPPPMRVKEKHGNAKRNRKRKGKYIMRMFTFNVLYMFKIILLLHVEDKEYNPCG
jgi:hypothetical protein